MLARFLFYEWATKLSRPKEAELQIDQERLILGGLSSVSPCNSLSVITDTTDFVLTMHEALSDIVCFLRGRQVDTN